jgi:hypothetical protein
MRENTIGNSLGGIRRAHTHDHRTGFAQMRQRTRIHQSVFLGAFAGLWAASFGRPVDSVTAVPGRRSNGNAHVAGMKDTYVRFFHSYLSRLEIIRVVAQA